jgi:hypothetical protein
LENLVRRNPDPLCPPRAEIDRSHLLDHNEAGHVVPFRDPHVQGVTAAGVGDRADDGEACMRVEEVVADHECRSPPALLVPSTRIEGDRDELPSARDVTGHLPDLAPGRRSPVEFLGLVVRGNILDEPA